MTGVVERFVSEEDGADLLEYAFIVGLVAVGCLVGMTNLSGGLTGFFDSVKTKLAGIVP